MLFNDPQVLAFQLIRDNPGAAALLTDSDGIVRVFNFGEADEEKAGPPYVVLSTMGGGGGSELNYMTDAPTIDDASLSVDIYASTPEVCRQVFREVIKALQVSRSNPNGFYVDGWQGVGRDLDTREYTATILMSSKLHRTP